MPLYLLPSEGHGVQDSGTGSIVVHKSEQCVSRRGDGRDLSRGTVAVVKKTQAVIILARFFRFSSGVQ